MGLDAHMSLLQKNFNGLWDQNRQRVEELWILWVPGIQDLGSNLLRTNSGRREGVGCSQQHLICIDPLPQRVSAQISPNTPLVDAALPASV